MSKALEIRSLLQESGSLNVSLQETDIPTPADHEVVVRIEASPINPSDLGVLFGPADISKVETSAEGVLTAPVHPQVLPRFKERLGKALSVGNEGAGVVVAAGNSPEAQALMGKTVGVSGGSYYAQYRAVPAMMCLPVAEGTPARDAASCFVNPMTALSMLETMRMEGHTALVHTAAASNLGQMLNKICIADGVELVNIVRKQEQEDILKALGAKYVINSSRDNYMAELIEAIAATGATLAFDATGGGQLASDILTAMEQAQLRSATDYSIYGTTVHKQVYLYGSLDMSPTTLNRAYGMSWGVGGWLLPNFLARAGMEKVIAMRTRVASELQTTFASHYTRELSFAEMLDADMARQYNAKLTGEKYLLCPQKDL
ncbi:MAG: zinc-binding dehydrogenase [Candidatus Pelagadaptatus aseana]|uniref:zinc-binding dehydrogenase n=1 Tax=Candidatus Pelagadaptatus aseana TaxID=3120508 RepID=UPI0039B1CCEF